MLYSLARPLLFTLAPERAHELTLSMLDTAHKFGLMHQKTAHKPVSCMGIEFPNPVGLAAGLDKTVSFLLEDRLRSLGAIYEKGPDFQEHAVRDGRLVTGQNPQSSGKVAELTLQAVADQTAH